MFNFSKFFKKFNRQNNQAAANATKNHAVTIDDLDAIEKKLEFEMEQSRINVIKWTALMLLVQALIILVVIRIFHNYL